MARTSLFALILAAAPACAVFQEVVRHETLWDPPVFFEASRAPAGLMLQVEPGDGGATLSVVERFDCIEEATQLGAEIVQTKPAGWLLTTVVVVLGVGTSAAIGFAGGALVDGATRETQKGRQTPTAQLIGAGVGIVGVGSQLLLMNKILEWLSKISQTHQRPIKRELGRKVPCPDPEARAGVLLGPGLPPEGVRLDPRGRAPPGFEASDGLTLDGDSVRQ